MREGLVAEILNVRELVITLGSKDGVQQGMRFAVLPMRPVEVIHPDTGESLGVIAREKIRVEASEVYDRFTICATYRKRTIPAQGVDLGLRALELGRYTPRREVVETLRADEAPHLPPLPLSESLVQIGDRVQPIEADDEDE